MAEIGEGRNYGEDEEQRPRKFTVVDKRITEEELEAAEKAPPPPPAPEPPKEARTIKVDVPATEAAAPTEAVAEAAVDTEAAQASAAAAAGIDPDPLAISNALLFFIEELFTRILIFLGLTPHPQTGLTIRNVEQAQRGIQLLDLLVREARKTASPEVDVYLERLLTQVKAAYTQIIMGSMGGGMPGAPRGPLVGA